MSDLGAVAGPDTGPYKWELHMMSPVADLESTILAGVEVCLTARYAREHTIFATGRWMIIMLRDEKDDVGRQT